MAVGELAPAQAGMAVGEGFIALLAGYEGAWAKMNWSHSS
jgi:hypothetical protein